MRTVVEENDCLMRTNRYNTPYRSQNTKSIIPSPGSPLSHHNPRVEFRVSSLSSFSSEPSFVFLNLSPPATRDVHAVPACSPFCLMYNSVYLMTGSGLPPELLQVSSKGFPSVAVGLGLGDILGGPGGVSTVTMNDCECRSRPLPGAFKRHSNFPLSRS